MDQETTESLPVQGVDPLLEAEGVSNVESEHEAMPMPEAKGSPNVESLHNEAPLQSEHLRPYVLPKALAEELSKLTSGEEKLSRCITCMQEILIGDQGVSFGTFWEIRRQCLDLFKQNINQSSRIQLWAQYTELCREARRLKEVFDEQSNFFTEQIEATLIAIKDDFANLETKLNQLEENSVLTQCQSLSNNMETYQRVQHELDYLNAFASRISSSRREVLKAQIRHKQKKHLLDSLSTLGDLVFPRRKELIQIVSQLFMEDVGAFIQNTFVGELSFQQLIEVQEEIKTIQHAARVLTLSTEAFSTTRQQLSECWNGLANDLNERKKAQHEKRVSFKKHKDELSEMLDLIKKGLEAGSMSDIEAKRGLHQLHSRLRSLPLSMADAKLLRHSIMEIENSLEERKVYSSSSKVKALEGTSFDAQRCRDLLSRLETLSHGEHERGQLLESLRDIVKIAHAVNFGRPDRLYFDRMFTEISTHLEENMRRHLTPDLHDQEELKAFLGSIYDHYEVVKDHIQLLRRFCGDSGASFTEAMELTDLLGNSQELLRRLESLHAEVEKRLTVDTRS